MFYHQLTLTSLVYVSPWEEERANVLWTCYYLLLPVVDCGPRARCSLSLTLTLNPNLSPNLKPES